MKTITMEIRKRSDSGQMSMRSVDLTELVDILTPEEVYKMEQAINSEVPSLRAHISINEETEGHYNRRIERL